ncbi:MAG: class I SAM-dependent methyltransferase [Candidatus Marinimicrobia bacterium]|nr:class I SAM-dependent methyltransferase [candidate division WOR-3 bacterium]MCK4445848.1 class I SAM-dependent methyltransferase [Candidatus Neomarinimicrobiota bacterium]
MIEANMNCGNSPLYQISQIIPDGSRILDIGAGNGILSRLLQKRHSNLIIDGIEPNSYAAKLAKKYYRNFYTGYAQNFFDLIAQEKYDYIILADVIEHIADPLEFLKKLASIISIKTKIILSIPNIAFGAIRFSLLNGNFDYIDSGIIERTHLRFFTLKTLETLISNSGLNIEKILFLQRSLFRSEIKIENLKISPFLFHKVKKDPLSFTYHFLIVLTKMFCVSEKTLLGKKDRFPFFIYLIKRHRNSPLLKIIIDIYHTIKSKRSNK